MNVTIETIPRLRPISVSADLPVGRGGLNIELDGRNVLRTTAAIIVLISFVNCSDQRDWRDVSEVTAAVKCGMSKEDLRNLCMQYGAKAAGEPTLKEGTPAYYCSNGDTGISFWFENGGLASYRVWDFIPQDDGATGKADPIIRVCGPVSSQPSSAAV